MPETDREALRAQARSFVNGPTFGRHFYKLHSPAWLWYAFELIRCATIIGFPAGIRALFRSGDEVFATPKLREGYRQLVETGRIVQGYIVINSGRLHGNPNASAPALVVASLAGTDEGDATAKDVCGQIVDRIHLEKPSGPADEAVATLIADEQYRAFRKRPLPSEFTGGREAHFLDVKIDNQLLRGHGLFSASAFYFLVDPTPRGMILQIPQEGATPTPPPLPVRPSAGGTAPDRV